jgi:hypothetical protein
MEGKNGFKKMKCLFIVMVIGILLTGFQPIFAASSELKIYDGNEIEISNVTTHQTDNIFIQTRLYVDGDWKGWEFLQFYVYDSNGKQVLYNEGVLTSALFWICKYKN